MSFDSEDLPCAGVARYATRAQGSDAVLPLLIRQIVPRSHETVHSNSLIPIGTTLQGPERELSSPTLPRSSRHCEANQDMLALDELESWTPLHLISRYHRCYAQIRQRSQALGEKELETRTDSSFRRNILPKRGGCIQSQGAGDDPGPRVCHWSS